MSKQINTCLNCKFEPDWGEETKGEYNRRYGKCKWDEKMPTLPRIYWLHKEGIVRFSDDSGVITNCPAWKPK